MEFRRKDEEEGFIETFTGIKIDPFNPKKGQFKIIDIAHALSNLCRFAGHCNSFYSVAQHSVECSYLVPEKHALSALLHDATEAYMVDIPTPIKNRLPKYMEKEDSLMEFIYNEFNLEFPLSQEVKDADKKMLEVEFEKYKGPHGHEKTMTPVEAERFFLNRFYELVQSRVIGHAVCVIIQNEDGKILAVSRKDDATKFGLPGGKVDPEDGTNYEKAIIRETKEETGIDIYDLKEIDVRDYSLDPMKLRTQHCFVAKYEGSVYRREYLDSIGEFGIVKWIDKEDFNFYKEYNNIMFDKIKI